MVTKEPDSLDTLVELACIFREKHDIFLRVIKLLTILCEIDEIRKVRNFLQIFIQANGELKGSHRPDAI